MSLHLSELLESRAHYAYIVDMIPIGKPEASATFNTMELATNTRTRC